jgi:hypothetical protein
MYLHNTVFYIYMYRMAEQARSHKINCPDARYESLFYFTKLNIIFSEKTRLEAKTFANDAFPLKVNFRFVT